MQQPWHVARPGLKSEIEAELASNHPGLRLVEDDSTMVARGTYAIPGVDPSNGRFFIEIRFPSDYPGGVPVAVETGGRIPRIVDRHINTDGTACLMVPEEWQVVAEDTSFKGFMDGPVKNFFIGQSLVELGQPWPHGERSHGSEGIVEAFSDLLGVQNRQEILAYLDYLQHRVVKGHWPCPCRSGQPIRRCHLDKVRALQTKITPDIARRMITRLAT
jgi:hypothetical protein